MNREVFIYCEGLEQDGMETLTPVTIWSGSKIPFFWENRIEAANCFLEKEGENA